LGIRFFSKAVLWDLEKGYPVFIAVTQNGVFRFFDFSLKKIQFSLTEINKKKN